MRGVLALRLWMFLLVAVSSLTLAADPGYLGFAVTVDIESSSLNPTLRTLRIDQVTPGSPAAKAGLVAGDLILEVQGIVVAGAQGDTVKAAMQKSVGETLSLRIKHGSAGPVEALITAAARP